MTGRVFVLTVVALTAIVIAACGGDDGDGSADGGTDSAAIAAEYKTAVERFRLSTFRADYKISLKTGDEGVETTFTWYKQGTRQQRFDYFRDEADERPAILLSLAGRSVICFATLVSRDTPEDVCIEGAKFPEELMSAETTLLALQAPSTAELDSEFETSTLTASGRNEREIAGKQATCFALSDAQGRTYEDCYSESGVPLYRRIERDGATAYVREATSVTSDVAEDAFAVPFEFIEPLATPTAVPTP